MTTAAQQYRITAHLSYLGTIDIENVFYLRVLTPGTDSDADVLSGAAAWLDEAYTFIQNRISNQVSFVDVRGFNITANAPIAPVAWPVLLAGSSAASAMATGVAACITFYTLVSRVRGRKFIGGLTENEFDNALLVTSFVAALTNFAITILAGPDVLAGGTTLEWGIRRKNGTFLVVPRFVISAIPAYQRRRRLGAGS
jgi:hypothetical protein